MSENGQVGQGIVRNVRVQNNRIENGNHPMRCTLQGIGLFDGVFEDWNIQNNIIVVDHWHGITVMGARRVVISDNVVVDAHPGEPGAPWVAITAHKDGRPSQNSLIKNNVTQQPLREAGSVFLSPQPGVKRIGNVVARSGQEALEYLK